MIKSVSTVNFKGETEQFELTGCDMFTGPNGSGKTRRIQAIEFCLRGAIGTVNANEELFSKFASGPKMGVEIVVNGDIITRSIKEDRKIVNGQTEYKYTGEMSILTVIGETVSGVKACEQWIKDELNIPSVAFNFSEFENMNTTERREFIKSIVNFSEMTADQFITMLMGRVQFEDMDADYSRVVDGAIHEISQAVGSLSGEQLINKALVTAEKNFKDFNKQRKADTGAASKFTQLKNEKEGNIRLVSKLEDSIAAAQAELTDQSVKLSTANQIISQKTADMASIERLNARKTELSTTDYDLIIEAHKANIREIEMQIQPVCSTYDRTTEIPEIEEHIKRIENGTNTLKMNLSTAQNELNDSFRRLKESEEMLLNIQGEFKCPLTKAICNADMGGIVQRIKESMDIDGAKNEESRTTIEALNNAISNQDKEVERAKAEIKLINESTRTERENNDKIAAHNRKITESVHNIDQKIAIAAAAKSGVDAKVSEIEAQINALMCKQYGEFEDPEETKIIIESLTEQIQNEKAELNALKEKQNLLQNQMRAIQDSQESELNFKVWSDIKAAIGLKGIQGDMIKSGLGPVVEEMNFLMKQLGRPEEFYFQFENKRGAEQFNFGWVRDGEEIAFDSLSRGEQLTLSAGLLVVFLDHMGAKLKLLMVDEINQLYGLRRTDFITGFSKLSDRLDNIIVCGAIDPMVNGLGEFELTEL